MLLQSSGIGAGGAVQQDVASVEVHGDDWHSMLSAPSTLMVPDGQIIVEQRFLAGGLVETLPMQHMSTSS
jgi:hypothetical protein